MSPSMASTLASRLFVYRWYFLAASLLSFALMVPLLVLRPSLTPFLIPLFGPLVIVPWALLCACTWFHPERGNMRSTSTGFSRLPHSLRVVVRWYSSVFLTLFLIVGLVIWPALVIAWL
jgi:hypothetical protein